RFLVSMTVSNKMLEFGRLMLLAAVGFLSVAPIAAPAAENEAATGVEANAEVPVPEIKKLFANNCSWCHGAYGMTADKGPRLAGSEALPNATTATSRYSARSRGPRAA